MFKPVNRHILISTPIEEEGAPTIILPEDYKPTKEKYTSVRVLATADDIRFELSDESEIIIDQSMVERIVINQTTYNVILDNYVVGIIN
tara:strand:- start:236 stop:502 length:267 start_codon:yes stop_codon:yes gene_type:complete